MADPMHPLRIALLVCLAIALNLPLAAAPLADDLPSDNLTAEINKRFAALNVKPGTADFVYRKAFRVRDAIKAGDFATAGTISSAILTDSHLQRWRFYPFDDFIQKIFTYSTDPQFERRLDEWVDKEPTASMPLLLRARYHYDNAWWKRGHKFSNKTSPERLAAFRDSIGKALADINAYLKHDDRNPYAFYFRLMVLRDSGLPQDFSLAFEDTIAKFPTYYQPYDLTLNILQPKWYGNIAAMYHFVDKYAREAPEFSPLKMLYLSLYRYVLSSIVTVCRAQGGDADKTTACVRGLMQKEIQPGLEQHVLAALQLYNHTDKYEFGLAAKQMILDMLAMREGESYSAAILQLAATSMHSDTQLAEDQSHGHNNYVIDELVAESWRHKGFYDNAITKYREALTDARSVAFPSDEEKDIALAFIYDQLSTLEENRHQFVDAIVYEKAAVTLGLALDQHRICYSYYQLKRYKEAIQSSTDAINATGNPYAPYWRGMALRDSGKPDDALTDFKSVAEADGVFASSAAINMSMIYFGRHDPRAALDVLNRYSFLYDPNRTTKSDVAVAYNNRCYAYMQLGELQKALDDCTQSLRFGSIPDAFRKQQELVKRLGSDEKRP